MNTNQTLPTVDQIHDAAGMAASFTFEGAEEIGSSDISCCARDACRHLGLDPDQMTREDFLVVRRAVQDAIRER